MKLTLSQNHTYEMTPEKSKDLYDEQLCVVGVGEKNILYMVGIQ